MTKAEQDRQALAYCCKNNPEAMEFLALFNEYVHRIDDWMDQTASGLNAPAGAANVMEKQDLLGTFALAIQVYSCPFYLKNLAALRQIAINVTNAYADVLAWEQSEEQWQKDFVDVMRHAGSEMVIATAGICGGWEHMRAVSAELRVICYREHHDEEGKPC